MRLYLLLPLIGLAIFLYSLRIISTSLLQLAGTRIEMWLIRLTRTPLRGALVGTLTTAIIQSSSATTAIVVAAINGGLLSLRQGLAYIIGANVGTTITAQLAALSLRQIILPALAAGLALHLLPRFRVAGRALGGLGLLFWGIVIMSENLAQLLHLAPFRLLFFISGKYPYLGILVGLGVTAVVQSSSAVTALVITLVAAQALDLTAALAITLGSNVGTCVTALLAAYGANRPARQAALAHLFFNVLGVAALLPFFNLFLSFIASTAPDAAHQVANGHTLFNLFSAFLFLLFFDPLARLIEKIA